MSVGMADLPFGACVYRATHSRVQPMTRPLVLMTATLVATTALAVTPVGELIANPAPYADTSVTIEGRVLGTGLPYRSEVGYTVQGGDDARINVVAHGAAPANGSRVRVTGKVGYRPPDEEFSFPPVILETSREALP
jgi:hypothetical protein